MGLRVPGVLALVVWGIIAAIEAFFLLPGMMLYTVTYPKYLEIGEDSSLNVTGVVYELDAEVTGGCDWSSPFSEACGVLGMSYLLLGIAALWACVVCCLRARIMLALGITQEAARALACMPALITFPVMQALGLAVFFVPWMIFSVYLSSSGNVVAETYTMSGVTVQVKNFEFSEDQRYAGLYMLFIWYWTTQFIVAIGQLVIALAVSTWYFTRDKSTIGNTTVFDSIRMAFRYHMGSAAFGSLIIAIIKTIRAVIMYLQQMRRARRTSWPQQSSAAFSAACGASRSA